MTRSRRKDTALTALPAGVFLPPDHPLHRLPLPAAALGTVALATALLLGWEQPARLLASYLAAYLFFVTVALGQLFFVLVQFVSRAGWSVAVRRLAEQGAATLPALAILFAPLALGLGELYPWARGAAAEDLPLAPEHPYLNAGGFYLRSALYLASWSAMAWWVRRRSLEQDRTGDPALTRQLERRSGPLLILFGLTLTFAAFDWVMSLEPGWHSTIFGVYLFSAAAVGGLGALILLVAWLPPRAAGREVLTAEHLHDLGKLLFAFIVFWAYIAFSQFLLIWYGNLPVETSWYADRMAPGWLGVTRVLAAGHFALPFFFLLPRQVKRRRGTLLAAAGWILAMHYLDIYWLVLPSLRPGGFSPSPLDLMTFLGLGALALASLALLLRRGPLLPVADPRLGEALAPENP